MSFGMNASHRRKLGDDNDDDHTYYGRVEQQQITTPPKNKAVSGFEFSEFRQQRLQSLAGLDVETSPSSNDEFANKARERVSFSIPRMDFSMMGGDNQSSSFGSPPLSSERTDSVRSNFGKVFDEDMLQLLNPIASRVHSFENRSSRRRSISNSSKNSPEVNSGIVDCPNLEQNESGLSSFLWKQSKEYLYVLIPMGGDKGFYKQDENIELDVQIKSKRIYAAFNEKGSDIPHEKLVDSELSIEVQVDESGWCIRNSHLLLELKKRDSSDDVQFPLQSRLRVRELEEEAENSCKYEVMSSDAPLHKEIYQ
ncbi:Hypothetical protein NAEGRDRAFT_82366, partial [Naegleria gruberi]